MCCILFTALFLTYCANESVPQGGAPDAKAPEIKKSSPQNKSVFFKGDKIEIIFNEFLKETGFAHTLISPPLEKQPDFRISGKKLTVKIKSSLRDSTTYTINFADDIKDLNEGNYMGNFTFVFSTGSYIDSQKLSGSVLMAKDNSTPEGIIVALYSQDTVDGILYAKPVYFSKTDKTGQFNIENIKEGKYHIYALKDQNFNYIYDQPNEQIAFSDSLIDITDTISKNVKLLLFEENKQKLRLDEARSMEPGKLLIIYNKPVSKFNLTWKNNSEEKFYWFAPTKDTIIYWYSKFYTEKDTLFATVNDSIFDTVRMNLKFIKKEMLDSVSRFSLITVNQSNKDVKNNSVKSFLSIQELYKPLKLNFTIPVAEINETKVIKILEDSTDNLFTPQFIVDKTTKQFITTDFEKKENTKYTLEISDSALQDIFGTWNKKVVYHFTTNGKSNYGNIRISLKTDHPEKFYTIKLLNTAGETVHDFSITGNEEKLVTVENILEGSYKFIVIEDTNKNGKWDTGDFKKKIQPEKVFTYKDVYQLKGGWDLDAVIKF